MFINVIEQASTYGNFDYLWRHNGGFADDIDGLSAKLPNTFPHSMS